MYYNKAVVAGALLGGVAVGAYAVYTIWKAGKEIEIAVPEIEVHEVIMFTQSISGRACAVDRLMYFINSPRQTLDICMYTITSMEISHIIRELHSSGVKIRIITDAGMAYNASNSKVGKFQKLGIPVRWCRSTNNVMDRMNHKFALVDAHAHAAGGKVLTGSLNWTGKGLANNLENVFVTSHSKLVSEYIAEFERLWLLFQ